MDATTPPFSEARYTEIVTELKSYLKKVGYNPEKVRAHTPRAPHSFLPERRAHLFRPSSH